MTSTGNSLLLNFISVEKNRWQVLRNWPDLLLNKKIFAQENSGFLAFWSAVEEAPKKEKREESFLILHPLSFTVSPCPSCTDKENVCVKLFTGYDNDSLDNVDILAVDIFDSAKEKQPFLFENDPIFSEEKPFSFLSSKTVNFSRIVCLGVNILYANGDRAVIRFSLKSQVKSWTMKILTLTNLIFRVK